MGKRPDRRKPSDRAVLSIVAVSILATAAGFYALGANHERLRGGAQLVSATEERNRAVMNAYAVALKEGRAEGCKVCGNAILKQLGLPGHVQMEGEETAQ